MKKRILCRRIEVLKIREKRNKPAIANFYVCNLFYSSVRHIRVDQTLEVLLRLFGIGY